MACGSCAAEVRHAQLAPRPFAVSAAVWIRHTQHWFCHYSCRSLYSLMLPRFLRPATSVSGVPLSPAVSLSLWHARCTWWCRKAWSLIWNGGQHASPLSSTLVAFFYLSLIHSHTHKKYISTKKGVMKESVIINTIYNVLFYNRDDKLAECWERAINVKEDQSRKIKKVKIPSWQQYTWCFTLGFISILGVSDWKVSGSLPLKDRQYGILPHKFSAHKCRKYPSGWEVWQYHLYLPKHVHFAAYFAPAFSPRRKGKLGAKMTVIFPFAKPWSWASHFAHAHAIGRCGMFWCGLATIDHGRGCHRPSMQFAGLGLHASGEHRVGPCTRPPVPTGAMCVLEMFVHHHTNTIFVYLLEWCLYTLLLMLSFY